MVKKVNGFHLKRCPDNLIDMDESLGQDPVAGHPVPETSDPGVGHPVPETSEPGVGHPVPETSDLPLGSPIGSLNDSHESIPPLPPPMPSLSELSRKRKVHLVDILPSKHSFVTISLA